MSWLKSCFLVLYDRIPLDFLLLLPLLHGRRIAQVSEWDQPSLAPVCRVRIRSPHVESRLWLAPYSHLCAYRLIPTMALGLPIWAKHIELSINVGSVSCPEDFLFVWHAQIQSSIWVLILSFCWTSHLKPAFAQQFCHLNDSSLPSHFMLPQFDLLLSLW